VTIDVEEVPLSTKKPDAYFEIDTTSGFRGVPTGPKRVLLIGLKSPAGVRPVERIDLVTSTDQARAFYGDGSQLARMCLAALRAYALAPIHAIALDERPGAPAAGSVTITGTATGAGAGIFHLAGRKVAIQIDVGDAPTALNGKLVAACENVRDLPVTAALDPAGDRVLFTARHNGAEGNFVTLRAEMTAPGITLTTSGPRLTGGTGVEDLQPALSVAAPRRYQLIAVGAGDAGNLAALREHLAVYGGALEMKGQVGISANTSTSALTETMTQAALSNHERLQLCILPDTDTLPAELAAAFAAVRASEQDPARPINGLPLRGVLAPDADRLLTSLEQETALNGGVTPLDVRDGVVVVVRSVVTRHLVPGGGEDFSLLDHTVIEQLDFYRDALRVRFRLKFERHKLMQDADGAEVPPNTLTPKVARSEMIDVARTLARLGYLQSPESVLDQFAAQINEADPNRIDLIAPAAIVPGAHVIAGRLKLLTL
jgi:phage tail sheath gpL-like